MLFKGMKDRNEKMAHLSRTKQPCNKCGESRTEEVHQQLCVMEDTGNIILKQLDHLRTIVPSVEISACIMTERQDSILIHKIWQRHAQRVQIIIIMNSWCH